MSVKGVDISGWNKGITIQNVKDKGYKFAILRGGYTGYGTGVSYRKDDCFDNWYNQAKAINFPIGVYWYSCANTYEKGVNEANYLYNNCLKGRKFEYPIYIDVEEQRWQMKDKKGVTDAIIGFCETLENKGYYVGIYASLYWFNTYIDTSRLNPYDKWVAAWIKNKPIFKYNDFNMWQYTDIAPINGTNADGNIAYVDYPTIIKNAGLNGYSKNTKPTTTPSTPTTTKPIQTKPILKVGTKVKTIAVGNGASDGSSNKAMKGLTGTITRIIPNAKYPYLVSDNQGALGWYTAKGLKII